MSRSCFVVMPIRKPGTEEFLHFRTIRDTIIEPALVAQGYEVERADDINQTGGITADIISRIAAADLVVADLTDLNPNVFYELGVRHVLRKNGTIMLVDETRSEIPFDLAQYRVIKYEPSLAGAEHVRRKLHDYADPELAPGTADNPVHTFLPALPSDLLAQVSGSVEGQLREELSAALKTLARYEAEHGKPEGSQDHLIAVLDDLVNQSRAGLLPEDLIGDARDAFEKRDTKRFLEACRTLFASDARLPTRGYADLANLAASLGLGSLEAALYEAGTRVHPDDRDFERVVLASLAHSTDSSRRQQARERYGVILNVKRNGDGAWCLPAQMSSRDRATLAVMLDAFHRDAMHEDALDITAALVSEYPDCDVSVRNFGRALEEVGRTDDAIVAYRASLSRSAGPVTARWFGNDLYRRDRYLDAAEIHLIAAILDPDDAEGFLDSAGRLNDALNRNGRGSLPFLLADVERPEDARPIPEEVSPALVQSLVQAAFAAPDLSSDDLNQALRDFGSDIVQTLLTQRQAGEMALSREDRLARARNAYEVLASDLTTDVVSIQRDFAQLIDQIRSEPPGARGQATDPVGGKSATPSAERGAASNENPVVLK